MRVCMIEPANASETGSIGVNFVIESARRGGFDIEKIDSFSKTYNYDVELISIHHPSDYDRLVKMPRHGKIRVIGGHITYNNPRPIIKFADYICMGDGESWIIQFLKYVKLGKDPSLIDGTLCCKEHKNGDKLPSPRHEKELKNKPYLNRAGTMSAAWYIEIARGCPFHCHYCELGNSMPYRFVKIDTIKEYIDSIDTEMSKKIVFFAPDEASHPDYSEMITYAEKKGVRQRFGSYRIDQVLKNNGLNVSPNQLVRVGIDGLTETTRSKVGKGLTNKDIVSFFKLMVEAGHVNFKFFQMFAHPWEKINDFEEWERLIDKIRRINFTKNVSLRIKWTPLIPQPVTPLCGEIPFYNKKMTKKIKEWHKIVSKPFREPGLFIEFDGLMSEKTHKQQIKLTNGDENLYEF